MNIMASPPVATERTHRYLYERFRLGTITDRNAARLTGRASESRFTPRDKGLDILLINPTIREWSYPNIIPIGLAYVGSVVIMDGHKLHVLDLNAERSEPIAWSTAEIDLWVTRRLTDTLARVRPDVIGIGGIITQYRSIRHIARVCREAAPATPIILGGGIASSMPEFMLQRLPIDIVCQEEGEVTISEVLHRLEMRQSLRGVAGVAYREVKPDATVEIVNNGLRPSLKAKREGLDELPWPARSHWPVDEVYKRHPVGHLNWKNKWQDGAAAEEARFSGEMVASRGCPYAVTACDYCYASYLGATYRLRSPREVVDEMAELVRAYGVSYVHFLDDLLMTDHRWAIEFFDELARRRAKGIELEFGATCRTNIIANDIVRAKKEGRPNILELGYEVGWRQAGYGVESASPTILRNIDKSGQTVEKILAAISETQRVLGYADCSFMIGSPGETRETVRETVEVCRQLGLKPEVFFFTTAYPATKFWQLALDNGLIRKAVTGEKGPADDDIIEQYFLKLGEQGEAVRTNFSDLPDEEVVELSWWAVNELGAQNTLRHPHRRQHPHSGDVEFVPGAPASGAVAASRADL
jgi:anaerobic magnesium-protoporphyrin IX monomethyl ester cyclase